MAQESVSSLKLEMAWVTARALFQPVTEEVGRRGVMASKRTETASHD
jgi:hypothetical protein